MKYLICGLGNFEPKYLNTRHNAGFIALDAFAKASNVVFSPARYGDIAEVKFKGRKLILLKPSTYMNLSGKAVRYWLTKEKLEDSNLLVLTDDIALPFGTLRLRTKGSDGGHNGLKNINEMLGTQAYARLRIGIGDEFGLGQQIDYVLGEWTNNEQEKLPDITKTIGSIIKSFCTVGPGRTMTQFNKKAPKSLSSENSSNEN